MILVVDDYPDACRGLVRLLKLKALPADCVYSGPDALAWMQDKKPTLVILDVMMPGMTGLEVLETMRADPQLADVPVVMFSASTNSEHRKTAMGLGALDFVVKSDIDYPTFLRKIVTYAGQPS